MSDHLEQLQKAVQAEIKDIRESFRQQQQLSPTEQRKAGLLLYPVNADSQYTNGSYTEVHFSVSFPINDTYFRKGCTVRCQAGDRAIEGRISELDAQSGTLVFTDDELPNFRDSQFSMSYIPDDRTLKCMELGCRLAGEREELRLMRSSLLDQANTQEPAFPAPELNPQQQLAAGQILGTQPAVLIQGPPGTGKTHTLAIAIKEWVKRGHKLMLTAPGNAATDHLCLSLLKLGVPFLRAGNEEKIDPKLHPFTPGGYLENGPERSLLDHLRKSLRKADEIAGRHIRNYTPEAAAEKQQARKERIALLREIRQAESEARQRLLQEIPVIAGTPVGLFNELPKTFTTDLVIMDEAGQSTEPLTWLVASFGKRLVLCGDPCQLPPVVFSQEAIRLGLHKSLLEQGRADKMLMLTEQYRMAPEIVAAINPWFYDNRLITKSGITGGTLRFIDMAGFGEGETQDPESGSTFHTDEAQITTIAVKHFNLEPANTVILSPYNAQLGILRSSLPDFKISTIDAMQGQEADHIVISLTRSNPEQIIGFLKDYRRTNVAISRARCSCTLIGDSATLGSDAFYNKLIAHIEQSGDYHSAWEFGH